MKKRTLVVRLDARVGDHFHCTVFANGASAGKLCLREREFEELVAVLGWSPDNDDPEFAELAREIGLGQSCMRKE